MNVSVSAARAAATVAASGFVLIAVFQVSLAFGAAWGRAAWGGTYSVLPTGLRIASGFSVVVLIAAALIVLGAAGFWGAGVPSRVFRWGVWGLAGLMTLSALGNASSSSDWERFLMAPIAALLALMCGVVALRGERAQHPA